MGKGKIIWSDSAKIKLFEIMEFYATRNKNKSYSIKLYKRIKSQLTILILRPDIGVKTELDSIRGFHS
jgi:hypothetical protein